MEREVRFCTTTDGVRIAYTIVGEGPLLVVTPFVLESFSNYHFVPEMDRFVERLAEGRAVALYDTRGTGLSQRDVAWTGVAGQTADLEAVVLSVGAEPIALWAYASYVVPAVRFVINHPEQVERLVLVAPIVRLADVFTDDALRSLAQLSRVNWSLAAQTFGDMSSRAADAEAGIRWANITRESTTGEFLAATFERLIEEGTDAWSELPSVTVPTMVLHRKGDLNVPFQLGQRVAAAIRNARFVPLDGVITHVAIGDQEPVLRAVLPFLGRHTYVRAKMSGLQTVLFTDIESSTPLTQRLGDERAQELVREHDRIVREALKAHAGSEIKHTGDGIMASFSMTSAALNCAVAIQRAFAGSERDPAARPTSASGRAEQTRLPARGEVLVPRAEDKAPIRVRIGLNAGEPIAEGEDLFGTTVQLARRVCDYAGGGEIVVANVVRELAAGKGFAFEDLGRVELKGFDEPAHLFELVWREEPARRRRPAGLTEREVEVLRLLAAGKSNSEIAEALVLSLRTVERHITNIYGKIGAHGKADATRYALEHGLTRQT